MRKVLSLLLLLAGLTVIFTDGCSDAKIAAEEGDPVTNNENLVLDGNLNEGYKTATFALG